MLMNIFYPDRGSIRVRGDKIATFVISGVQGLVLINVVVFLGPMDMRDFLRVVWVPPEIRDKVVEPLTSVEQETADRPRCWSSTSPGAAPSTTTTAAPGAPTKA